MRVVGQNGQGEHRSKRFLITGGAGFIGSHLADSLVARGDSVVILDDLSTGRRENVEHLLETDRVDFVEGSTLTPTSWTPSCGTPTSVCI